MLAHIKQRLDFRRRGVKVWTPSNVYLTAIIGDGVSIGMFSEIGHLVKIGNDTRIGKGCFIPEGVIIGKNCFIGPHVCIANDRYMAIPPYSARNWQNWEPVIIEDMVRLGANSLIRPGVIIGTGAVIGLGAVVTKNVGPFEVWVGNPAYKLKEGSNGQSS